MPMRLYDLARYDESEAMIKSFAFDYERYPFHPFYVDCFDLLGAIQQAKKRVHLAVFYGQLAVSLAEEKKAFDRLPAAYGNLSLPYQDLKEYAACLECLDKALLYTKDPEIILSLIYNKASVLMGLGRLEEARKAIDEVERMAKALPQAPLCLEFLPFCKAEIDLAMGEKVDLHALAHSFLAAPFQKRSDLRSYVLEEDEYLYSLLWKKWLQGRRRPLSPRNRTHPKRFPFAPKRDVPCQRQSGSGVGKRRYLGKQQTGLGIGPAL
jgi:tetratricopeptide (TPR) repeat protein